MKTKTQILEDRLRPMVRKILQESTNIHALNHSFCEDLELLVEKYFDECAGSDIKINETDYEKLIASIQKHVDVIRELTSYMK